MSQVISFFPLTRLRRTTRLQVQRYSVAVLTVACALGAMLAFNRWANMTTTPFLLFSGAIIVSAWYGGTLPGIVSTILSTLISHYFFLEPIHTWSLSLPNLVRLALFVVEGTLISILCGALQKARKQSESSLHSLRQSEQSLQAAHAQVSQILESITDGFFALDHRWCLTYTNQRFQTTVGRSRDQLLGYCIWDILPEPARLKLYPKLQQAIAQQTPVVFETSYLICPDHWFELRAYPAPEGLAVYFQEITERKQTEKKLQQTEQHFRDLAENIDEVFWIYDLVESRVIYVSSAYERIWGRSCQSLYESPQSWLEAIHPEDRDRVMAQAEQWLQGHQAFEAEYRIVRSPDEVHWIWARTFPVVDDAGQTYRRVGIAEDMTERKQAEEIIRHSEERLRVALKNSPITVFNQDRDLRYTWLYNNPRSGLPVQEVVGKRDSDLLPPESAAIVMRLKQQVITTGVGLREEIKLPIGSEWLHFDMTVEPLRNANQDVIGVTCAAIDITQYKRVEEALRASQTLLNAFLSCSPIGLGFVDQNFRYVHVNEALAQLNGVPLSEHLGQTIWDVLPELAPRLTTILEQVMQTQQPLLNYEFIGETYPPGVVRHCLISYYPVYLATGQFLGIGVTALDISELKRTEQALRESESRFRRLVQSNLVGCMFWDADGTVLDANDAFLQMVGYSREDLNAGRLNWKAMTPPDLLALSEGAIAQMRQVGAAPPLEKKYIRKDGSLIPILFGGVMFEDSQDRGVSFVVDLTELKRAEAERERLLASERKARSQAEAANRIKDEFLAVLSHELRTPLNPILGWAKLLRQRPLDPATTERALETIERNAKLQTQLIEDLLDVSRILRGKLSIHISSVDLVAVVEAALETVRLAAEAKSIAIQTEFAPNIGSVSGDANRLQQVVWNLLSNAIKFTPSSGQVTVNIAQLAGQARIQVKDTGQGIDPEFLPHVFDYFRQADSTTTRQFGGLGLGLAIARHLVELHGGTLQAESLGAGQGATFTIWLPLRQGHAAVHPGQIPIAESYDLQGIRILVVDDDTDMRQFLTFVLEQAGAVVMAVDSAVSALEQWPQLQPDILLSDIGMPEMDGYMLIQEVQSRRLAENQPLRAIALTAYASEANQQQALAAGFQQHLAKPIEPAQLLAAIANLANVSI